VFISKVTPFDVDHHVSQVGCQKALMLLVLSRHMTNQVLKNVIATLKKCTRLKGFEQKNKNKKKHNFVFHVIPTHILFSFFYETQNQMFGRMSELLFQ